MECILRVLMVENSDEDVAKMEAVLSKDGFDLYSERVETAQMLKSLKQKYWDLVLFSNEIENITLENGIKLVREINPDLPFVVISSETDEELIVYAMRLGASDFVSRKKYSRLLSVVRRDVSEFQMIPRIKSNQLQIAKNEERYRRITESITDVLIVLDSNLKCVYWNRAAEKLTGVTARSALTRPFYELFPENPGLEIQDMLKSVLEQPKTTISTFIMTREEKEYQYEICAYPNECGLTLIIREIPQYQFTQDLINPQVEKENQLTQSQKLRILGLLTSGVAHEVRNPLNAISVVLEALFQELGDKPDYLLYKDHVFTHVERLTRLMQDLLELGKPIERSKVVIVNFYDLVKESVALWKSSGDHSDYTIEIKKAETEEELKIKCDPLKLQQVFMNILENASQHSPKGTVISICVQKEGKYVKVNICDQGTGIKEDNLKRMFEPFFTTRKKGTGLGLAIVKHILEVHNGTVSIRNSNPGPGCTVDFELPLYQVRKPGKFNTIEPIKMAAV
ncbi:MAG: PAS domain-containing protein [Fibrobacter sp.]|jgi:PAS domain S-box-containing protein|nr:PAS domain-containing protein [Fibrobacter sp.]